MLFRSTARTGKIALADEAPAGVRFPDQSSPIRTAAKNGGLRPVPLPPIGFWSYTRSDDEATGPLFPAPPRETLMVCGRASCMP